MPYNIAQSGVTPIGAGLRRLIDERAVSYGGSCSVPSPFLTEVVSASGCDWLSIDLQHGLIDDAAMRVMVQAAAIRRTPVLVRVAWNEPASIMRALDAGADGVIVPMVNTPEDALRAVGASRYPPAGYRSWGPMRAGLAQPGFDPALGNEQVVCLVMIETVEAVENLDAILDVPGVDGVMVGTHDLAISHAGTNAAAGVDAGDVAMLELVANGCRTRGQAAGVGCADAADALRWTAMGFTLLALPGDAALVGEGMARLLRETRQNTSVVA